MPHPSSTREVDRAHRGWSKQAWSSSPWGGGTQAGFAPEGQIVIRHDNSNDKKKRLRQRQVMS